MALSIGLCDGGKLILGLNGLKGSCDQVGVERRIIPITVPSNLISSLLFHPTHMCLKLPSFPPSYAQI